VVEESGAGIVIEPEDPASLFQTIASLKEHRELTTMSEAGRRYARTYWDEDLTFPRMEAELMKIANKVETSSSSDVSLNSVRVQSQAVVPE
jgi:hypothetical protein